MDDIAAASSLVRLSDVRLEPLSVDEVQAAIADPHAGGVALFVGVVRDVDHGREVDRLEYSAHPTAIGALTRVASEVASRHDVRGVAAVHRVGVLTVGDLAVVVGVSATHRGAALDACRDLIDTLKTTVPIWKHQVFSDGSDEWVGTP